MLMSRSMSWRKTATAWFTTTMVGVSIPNADGVLRKWGNYGPLVTALLVLDEEGSVP